MEGKKKQTSNLQCNVVLSIKDSLYVVYTKCHIFLISNEAIFKINAHR